MVAPVDIFWPRNVAQENFFFCFDSKTQRRAFLGYLYVLLWTLHVLWTSGVPILAWCVVTCLRGSSRLVMELRRFLGFSQVVPLVPCMQQITAWAMCAHSGLGWWRQASAIRYGLARRLPRGGHDLISP